MAYAQWISLEEAAALVPDGATLALGGMTVYRRPVAFARALLARTPRPRDLTLLSFTGGYESDILVGGGCVGTVRSCYFGLESFRIAAKFTAAAHKATDTVGTETAFT